VIIDIGVARDTSRRSEIAESMNVVIPRARWDQSKPPVAARTTSLTPACDRTPTMIQSPYRMNIELGWRGRVTVEAMIAKNPKKIRWRIIADAISWGNLARRRRMADSRQARDC